MQNKKYYPQSGQTSYLAPKKNTQDNEIDPYSTFERKKLRERDQKNDSKLSSEIESEEERDDNDISISEENDISSHDSKQDIDENSEKENQTDSGVDDDDEEREEEEEEKDRSSITESSNNESKKSSEESDENIDEDPKIWNSNKIKHESKRNFEQAVPTPKIESRILVFKKISSDLDNLENYLGTFFKYFNSEAEVIVSEKYLRK